MKKLFYLLLIAILFIACNQEQRYFAESEEISTLEEGIAAYEAGDWEKWQAHFADTAKIYVNSTEPISVSERVANLNEMTAAMASYGFDHEDDHIEMVVDKNDETWVYYWATHKGTFAASNKTLTIPVHLAIHFVDGKAVAEHVYFDATEMNAEFAAMAAAAESANEESADDSTN